jgi:hypothetical protein
MCSADLVSISLPECEHLLGPGQCPPTIHYVNRTGSLLRTVTCLRTARSWVRLQASLHNILTLFLGPLSLVFGDYRGFPLTVKRTGLEAGHYPSSSNDVKNQWSYTSTPFMYLRVLDRPALLFYLSCCNT